MGGFFGGLVGAGQTGEQIAQGKEINRQRQMSDEEFQQQRQEFQVFLQQAQQQMAGEKQRQGLADPNQRYQALVKAGIPDRQARLMSLGVSPDMAISADQLRPEIEKAIKDLPPETQGQMNALFDVNVIMGSPQKGVQAVTAAAQQWRQQQETEKNLDRRLEATKEKTPSDANSSIANTFKLHGWNPDPNSSDYAKHWDFAHKAYTKETKVDPGMIRMEVLNSDRMVPGGVNDKTTGTTIPMTVDNYKKLSAKEPGRWVSPQYDPELQAKVTQARDLPVKDVGTQVQSFGTFIRHVGDLYGAISELKNTNSPLINRPMNWLRTNSGDPQVKKFMAKLEPARTEFAKFLQGNKALHDMDKENAEKIIGENDSPAAMFDVLPSMVDTAKIRLGELNSSYKASSGKNLPYLVTPSAALAMRKMGIAPPQVGDGETGQLKAPVAGTVKNGYRFKGGDPADKNSWVKQ